jgi:hypothetical protein
VKPNVLRGLTGPQNGTALGIPFIISTADRNLLQTFIQQLGLADKKGEP